MTAVQARGGPGSGIDRQYPQLRSRSCLITSWAGTASRNTRLFMKFDVPGRVCFCLVTFTRGGALACWARQRGPQSLRSDWMCLKRSGSLERGRGRVINNDLVCIQPFTVYKAQGRDRGLTEVSTADREGPDAFCGVKGADASMGSWLLGSQGGEGWWTRVQLLGPLHFSISPLAAFSWLCTAVGIQSFQSLLAWMTLFGGLCSWTRRQCLQS